MQNTILFHRSTFHHCGLDFANLDYVTHAVTSDIDVLFLQGNYNTPSMEKHK